MNTGDIFPLTFPYISSSVHEPGSSGEYKAFCLFWVRKEASLFHFKNDLMEIGLCLAFLLSGLV